MEVKSKYVSWDAKRSIIISDIHGNKELLEQLLQKCEYDEKWDHLFILGDMVEKGKESLATLRMIMELSERALVDVVMGNCEAISLQIMNGYDLKGLCHYLHHAPWKRNMLLWEMADACGVEIREDGNNEEAFAQILKSFAKEFAFLSSLPHVLESEDYIFVHAGVESDHAPYAKDADTIMKNDYFGAKDVRFDKLVICGHTPVINYHESAPSAIPYLDDDKNVFLIDGGCGVRKDGQLNALICIDDCFHSVYVDDLPQGLVIDDAFDWEEEYPYSITERNREVIKRRRVKDGWDCYHVNYRREIWVPDDFLYEEGGKCLVKDYSDYRLQVDKGDKLALISEYKDDYYVKYRGRYGWVKKSNIKPLDDWKKHG